MKLAILNIMSAGTIDIFIQCKNPVFLKFSGLEMYLSYQTIFLLTNKFIYSNFVLQSTF